MSQMHLVEAYRQLEIEVGASEEAVRRAYLDLTKVWHPDRFAHDPSLRAKAQEKLKSINVAYDAILSARRQGRTVTEEAPPRQSVSRYLSFAISCGLLGLLILLRRPTTGGLIIAAILLLFSAFTLARIRRMRH
jgi:CHASE2 domain-containing sensor protein